MPPALLTPGARSGRMATCDSRVACRVLLGAGVVKRLQERRRQSRFWRYRLRFIREWECYRRSPWLGVSRRLDLARAGYR